MAPDVAAIERLAQQPIAVDPAAIEAEFSRIWSETAGAGFDDSSIRLRVVNLVALARREEEWVRFEEVMGLMPRRHPCRGILALADPARDTLEASISAHCWRSTGGNRHVCSEEVILLGGRTHERQLASAVLALLVPDIPLAVWFMGDVVVQGRLATGLVDEANRVIVDSSRADDVLRVFDTACRLREEQDVRVADLAWLRLAGWRALVAQLFDEPEHAPELARITRISIEGAPGASEPLLFAGWLVSRLGYTPADVTSASGEMRATLYAGSRAVSVRLAQQSSTALSAVRLEAPHARFSVTHDAVSGHLCVQAEVGDGPVRERIVEPTPSDDAAMISLALDGAAEGEAYLDSVAAVQALLG